MWDGRNVSESHCVMNLLTQIAGDLLYPPIYLEGRFLRLQITCGQESGCLPFKVKSVYTDFPGMMYSFCSACCLL